MFQIPIQLLQQVHFTLTSATGFSGITVGDIDKIREQLRALRAVESNLPEPVAAEPAK